MKDSAPGGVADPNHEAVQEEAASTKLKLGAIPQTKETEKAKKQRKTKIAANARMMVRIPGTHMEKGATPKLCWTTGQSESRQFEDLTTFLAAPLVKTAGLMCISYIRRRQKMLRSFSIL